LSRREALVLARLAAACDWYEDRKAPRSLLWCPALREESERGALEALEEEAAEEREVEESPSAPSMVGGRFVGGGRGGVRERGRKGEELMGGEERLSVTAGEKVGW
jgi:hypothetical protein